MIIMYQHYSIVALLGQVLILSITVKLQLVCSESLYVRSRDSCGCWSTSSMRAGVQLWLLLKNM